MATPVKLAVLASGGGSNLQALIDAHERGDLPAEVVLVISNNSSSGALSRARTHAISALHISANTDPDPGAAILAALNARGVDVVALAGYMKLVDPRMLAAFPDRVINIHPGPLPRFGGQGMFGSRVHEAVLAAGERCSGPTVHLVNEVYDEGAPLAFREVPVLPRDDTKTLADRVLAAEHDLYWRVIRDVFCRG